MVTPWRERHNRFGIFDPSNGGNVVAVGTPGFPKETVTDGRYTNLAPRAGFAYSIDSRTVVRGGFGIFWQEVRGRRARSGQRGDRWLAREQH